MSYEAPVLNPDLDVQIDEHNLSKEYRTLASVIYRYSVARLEAQEEVEGIKDVYKKQKALALLQINENSPKATAKIQEAKLEIIDDLKMFEKQVRKAEMELKYIESTIEALKIKEKMIMQLGADSRRS